MTYAANEDRSAPVDTLEDDLALAIRSASL